MSSFTPGPWHVAAGSLDVWADGGYTICEVYPPSVNSAEKEANARLIAAAPELLESLKDAVFILNDLGAGGTMMDRFKSAIAKATGKEPA